MKRKEIEKLKLVAPQLPQVEQQFYLLKLCLLQRGFLSLAMGYYIMNWSENREKGTFKYFDRPEAPLSQKYALANFPREIPTNSLSKLPRQVAQEERACPELVDQASLAVTQLEKLVSVYLQMINRKFNVYYMMDWYMRGNDLQTYVSFSKSGANRGTFSGWATVAELQEKVSNLEIPTDSVSPLS